MGYIVSHDHQDSLCRESNLGMICFIVVHVFCGYTIDSTPGTPAISDCWQNTMATISSALTTTRAAGTGSVLTTLFSVVITPLE